MTKFTSTRDATVLVDGATAVINGLSADGGLFVPEKLSKLGYVDMLESDYAARLDKVLRAFFDFDVSGVAKAADASFDGDPAPTVKIDDNAFMLELWHGRTHAVKDMSMSVLPQLLVRAKAEKGISARTLVLVATGCAAGKAALEGFCGVDGVECCALYPTDGMGSMQKLEITTQRGDNVCAAGIVGGFGDVQKAVAAALSDDELSKRLSVNNTVLSSASAANVGRLVPQIAYYFSAYCDLVESNEIRAGEKIDFVVPTGNFDNVLAGYYAREMGLPVNKLVCASDRNNGLTDFFDTGIFDVNRGLGKIDCYSSDGLVSSNLERLIYELSGRNAELTASRMTELKRCGRYSLTETEHQKIREAFAADTADDDDVTDAIADTFEEYGYLMDTQTAAAWAVAQRREFVRPTVVVSTANPFKSAPAVMRAIGLKCGGEANADMLLKLEEETAMEAPKSLTDVFSAPVRFDAVIKSDEIIQFICNRYCNKSE